MNLDHNLFFNTSKKQFVWKGSIDELHSFISYKFNIENETLTRSGNDSRIVWKTPNLTFNFYVNTKTLQVQGKLCEVTRIKMTEIVDQVKVLKALTQEDEVPTESHNPNTDDEQESDELIEDSDLEQSLAEEATGSSIVDISGTPDDGFELPSSSSCHIKSNGCNCSGEIKNLWAEVESLKKFKFPATVNEPEQDEELRLLRARCAELENKVTILEQEKSALISSLRIMSTNGETPNVSKLTPNVQPRTNVASVNQHRKIKSNNPKNTQSSPRSNNKASNSTITSNERTQSHKIHTEQVNKTVFIAGDSIIKHIEGWKLSKEPKVKVHSFPGCNTTDMADYIKPIIRKNPANIILHVGTNDLQQSESPRACAEKIVDLANSIAIESPATTVSLSALTTRSDRDGLLVNKVKEVNKVLRTFCNQNDWGFISNDNITDQHLNRSGLHLSRSGTSLLAQNFIKHIKSN